MGHQGSSNLHGHIGSTGTDGHLVLSVVLLVCGHDVIELCGPGGRVTDPQGPQVGAGCRDVQV